MIDSRLIEIRRMAMGTAEVNTELLDEQDSESYEAWVLTEIDTRLAWISFATRTLEAL